MSYLLSFLQVRHGGGGFSLKDKITATNFVQKKKGTVINPTIQSNPVVKLPTAETFVLSEDKEKKLSEIIAEQPFYRKPLKGIRQCPEVKRKGC